MPTSVISTLRPTYTSDSIADKVKACRDFIESQLPTVLYQHINGGTASWFLYKQWRYDNTDTNTIGFENDDYFPYNQAGYSYLVGADRARQAGYIGWFKFVNDFASYNIGLLYMSYDRINSYNWTNVVIVPGYASKPIYSSSDLNTVKFYVTNNSENKSKFHTILGSTVANTSLLDDFKLYTYSSPYFAYIGFMNMDRCVVVTRAYKIDDPTQETSVILMSCINKIDDNYLNMMSANTIDIFMDQSRVPITYIDTIDNMPQSMSLDKIIMHKLVVDGYYFNNIFRYTGAIPSNHFKYNGSEYVKIACNLLLKFD